MTKLLTKLFIKDREHVERPAVRRAYGTLSSITGILVNLLLFTIKMIAGTLAGSLAIRADAFNNLSDAGSSVISLVSFKISAKPADRHHPFGHARIEYVASMIVCFLIFFIGIELVSGAVDKFLAPTLPLFNPVALIILVCSVLFKLWLGFFNRTLGKKIDSEVLRATCADSFSDAAATAVVLIATLVSPLLPEGIGQYVDPVMSILVAVMVFVAGARILNETKNAILGEAPSDEVIERIRATVSEFPEAIAVHDMVVHNYGVGHTIASLHVEVDGRKDIFALHDTIDLIERRLREELSIEATIHLDPILVGDPTTDEWRARVEKLAEGLDARIRIHDFRMVPGHTHTNLIFDMAVPFELAASDDALKAQMAEAVAKDAPSFFTVITVDRV
jgi:cation diffusion facilitator family transporter